MRRFQVPFTFRSAPRRAFASTWLSAGDSTRAYLSSCDGGNVNVINTTTDTYDLNILAPNRVRASITRQVPNILPAKSRRPDCWTGK